MVYRYLEMRLDEKYTASQLISQLREMNMTKLEGYGYIPSYDRNNLTNELHQAFGFDTSTELIPIGESQGNCLIFIEYYRHKPHGFLHHSLRKTPLAFRL